MKSRNDKKKKKSRLQSYTHFLFIYLFVFAFDTSVINQVMALSYLKKKKNTPINKTNDFSSHFITHRFIIFWYWVEKKRREFF